MNCFRCCCMMILLSLSLGAAGAEDLIEGARKGDTEEVRKALDAGAPVDAPWRYDQTPLYIAAFRGHAAVVKLLLDRGANPNVRDSFYKMSAVEAAAGKSPEILGMLVAKGASGAEPMLIRSSARGDLPTLKVLLENRKWSDDVLADALAAAESRRRQPAIEQLQAAGAKSRPAVAVDSATKTSLAGVYAVANGPEATITFEGDLMQVSVMRQNMDFRPMDASRWVGVEDPGGMKIVFTPDASGKVTGFDLSSRFFNGRFNRVAEPAARPEGK